MAETPRVRRWFGATECTVRSDSVYLSLPAQSAAGSTWAPGISCPDLLLVLTKRRGPGQALAII